jgi:hypothetical protein
MKMATSTSLLLIGSMMLLVAASAASSVMPLATAVDAGLSVDFHAASCPNLENIVRAAVQAARAANVQVTAGLLRIFFHDCLPEVLLLAIYQSIYIYRIYDIYTHIHIYIHLYKYIYIYVTNELLNK